jgi:hypothetical protein
MTLPGNRGLRGVIVPGSGFAGAGNSRESGH